MYIFKTSASRLRKRWDKLQHSLELTCIRDERVRLQTSRMCRWWKEEMLPETMWVASPRKSGQPSKSYIQEHLIVIAVMHKLQTALDRLHQLLFVTFYILSTIVIWFLVSAERWI
ncbi:hypothetical protein P167DRAFT_255500 [Morchella conica CCBAS932]|uniref:Uncharacterized protein n=1 Tax=Morchella conica CCBAS932 TaxID=1392247 RepID=A0A3N4KM09_9PEZI|nr:hypothetical protein P167DRAFT_255500 [Morchella conica CCBAS932]